MRSAFLLRRIAALAAVVAVAACGQDQGAEPAVTPTGAAPVAVTNLTIVQGQVEDDGGSAAAVEVAAQLWPFHDVQASVGPGGSVPMHPVGAATTGADGRFAFALDPTTVPAEFRNGTGDEAYVELEVFVAGDRGSASWNLTAFTAGPWSASPSGGAGPVWTLVTDQDRLPPSHVDVVLVLDGQSLVRTR